MRFDTEELNKLIKRRKSVYPQFYTNEKIADELLLQILENANWAPNHKKTMPWRFILVRGKAKVRLGEYLADSYKNETSEEKFSEKKYQKKLLNPTKADTIIAIILERNQPNLLPEWEEIAAVAMAVQNMWLTCTANNLGCYWSTPKPIVFPNNYFGLEDNKSKCLGLFYIAHQNMPNVPRQRPPFDLRISFLE